MRGSEKTRTQRFADIRERVASLRTNDATLQLFGAEEHEYRLFPAAHPDDVEEFEQEFSVALPEEYRAFVLEVADGGAGPGLGLTRLGANPMPGHQAEFLIDEGQTPESLRRPFPTQTPFWSYYSEPPDPRPPASVMVWDGAVTLCDYGCAIFARLVLNGPHRGTVWVMENSSGTYVPFQDDPSSHGQFAKADPRPHSFLDWYENWVDAAEREIASRAGSAG